MNVSLIQQVLRALEQERVQYVVFGAVAMALHGLRRATEDLDLFIDEITADDLLGEYPAVQYGPPDGPFLFSHIDLLTRLGERFDFASLESERVDFGGVTVSVVTPAMLFEMKRETDAERIARRFDLGGK